MASYWLMVLVDNYTADALKERTEKVHVDSSDLLQIRFTHSCGPYGGLSIPFYWFIRIDKDDLSKQDVIEMAARYGPFRGIEYSSEMWRSISGERLTVCFHVGYPDTELNRTIYEVVPLLYFIFAKIDVLE